MQANIQSNAALQNVLASLEISRQKIATTQKKGYLFVGIGAFIAIGGSILGLVLLSIITGLVPLVYGIVLLIKINGELQIYKMAFKRDVIGTALKSIDESLTLEPSLGIYEQEFVESQLFSTSPDRYKTEDLVRGNAGKTAFYFAEVHAEYRTEEKTDNGKRIEWHDIFKGIIFVADFNKNFGATTIVRPKGMTGAIGAWLSKNIFSFGNDQIITLENPDFQKTFITYGTDQVESRYILTPALMERILQLNAQSGGTISVTFTKSRMYIAFFLSRNHFEAPIFKTLLDPKALETDIATINFMYGIVRELDLNTRIWGKT